MEKHKTIVTEIQKFIEATQAENANLRKTAHCDGYRACCQDVNRIIALADTFSPPEKKS